MSKELSIFNDILLLHLRPWKVQSSDQKYRQLANELKKQTYRFQPLYEVAFIKPVSDKRKYYHALITFEAIAFFNSIHTEIETALNNKERKYWVTNTLNKVLKSKFRDVRTVIEQKHFELSSISVTNDDAYIIQLLKYQLVRLYLEIQNGFIQYLSDEKLEIEDILENFFSDPKSDKTIIVEAEKLNIPEPANSVKPQKQTAKFTPCNYEIRETKDGVLSYENIVDKPDALGRIESILFNDEYIDKDFVLLNDQGNILKLAAIAQVMYRNHFFKKVTFVEKKKINIKDRHVRRFLNLRYRTNIDQQFRRFNNEDVFQDFVSKNIWLRNLPTY